MLRFTQHGMAHGSTRSNYDCIGYRLCDRASQLHDNLAVALRPGWQGGTLSGDTLAQVRRIVEEELRRAAA